MPTDNDIVELTVAPALRAQEVVHGLEAIGIAARLHDLRGVEGQPTTMSRVLVFRRDLDDARAALPNIGRDVIAEPIDACPACGHDIAGRPLERCPECGLALPVPGRDDPVAHFGPVPGSHADEPSSVLRWALTTAAIIVITLIIISVVM
jgi:hypothetical protein